MQDWSRPDPLTRDLIHLINARRHDHWDVDAALDTLTELIQQGREEEILTVLAALDEDMAEWLFDLVAEAASTTVWGEGEEESQGGSLLTIALPLQASFEQPLRLTVNQEETAALLRRYLHLSQESQVVVEPKLLTDTTLERLSLQGLYAHVETVFNGTRSRPFAARLHTPMEHTVYLMFGVREEGEPTLPQELGPEEQEGVLQGLRAQCSDLAPAPHLREPPVYAAYALFDAKGARASRTISSRRLTTNHPYLLSLSRFRIGSSRSAGISRFPYPVPTRSWGFASPWKSLPPVTRRPCSLAMLKYRSVCCRL